MANDAVSAINEQIALLEAVHNQTEATIKALNALKEQGSALIPLSPDCFIPISLKEEKALVAVGGDVLLEKSVDEAIKILERRKTQIHENIEHMKSLRRKLAERGSNV